MDSNIPSWNTYFLGIARAVSLRSKDPATKVGALLVDPDNHIIGTGYNGFPPGMPETPEMWERPAKYSTVIHAEANCLLHAVKSAKGCTIFTTMYPCLECSKLIAAAQLKRIVFSDDKYKSAEAEYIFKSCGIKVDQIT